MAVLVEMTNRAQDGGMSSKSSRVLHGNNILPQAEIIHMHHSVQTALKGLLPFIPGSLSPNAESCVNLDSRSIDQSVRVQAVLRPFLVRIRRTPERMLCAQSQSLLGVLFLN